VKTEIEVIFEMAKESSKKDEELKRLREDNDRLTQRLCYPTVNENRKWQCEVERLRCEAEGHDKEVDTLVDHILELRRLLRKCRDYFEAGMSSGDTDLFDIINKELSNE